MAWHICYLRFCKQPDAFDSLEAGTTIWFAVAGPIEWLIGGLDAFESGGRGRECLKRGERVTIPSSAISSSWYAWHAAGR